MKLHTTASAGLNSVTAYGSGYIAVNGHKLEKSFILTPQQLVDDWTVFSIAALVIAVADQFKALSCDIVLLGTGNTQRFPDRSVLRAFLTHGIGLEVMDSFAACRTYNILMAEGRAVALAVIVDSGP